MESAEGRAPAGSASRWLFGTAALAPVAAGALLLAVGARAFRTPWAGETLALAHLGTLGFLLMGLSGALFRALPESERAVRAGIPLWRAFHAGLCVGLAGFVCAFLTGARPFFFGGLALLFASVLVLLVAVVPPLWRLRAPAAPQRRTAIASLALTVFLGAWMGHAHVGVVLPGDRALWLPVHLSIGLLGFVGAALGAIAPAPAPRWTETLIRIGVSLLVLCWAAGLFAAIEDGEKWAGLAALPAAVAVWGVRPFGTLRAKPASVWVRGSAQVALVSAAAACLALASDGAASRLVFGWLAIGGWAGLFVHGLVRGELAAAPPRAG